MNSVALGTAAVAGLVSFLSPCVLPIIPGFLAYLAGASTKGEARRLDIFLNSLLFVLGFSLVFALLGVLLNSILAGAAPAVNAWLARIGGLIIIFFGLYLTRLIRIPFLERDYQFKVSTRFKSSYITSLLFGAAFAAGWTPCVGAVLGSILTLAAVNPGSAFALLFSYSLGLGVPFLLVGAFTASADRAIARLGKAIVYLNIVFGALLIVIGIFAFTQNLTLLFNLSLLNSLLLR